MQLLHAVGGEVPSCNAAGNHRCLCHGESDHHKQEPTRRRSNPGAKLRRPAARRVRRGSQVPMRRHGDHTVGGGEGTRSTVPTPGVPWDVVSGG